MWQFIRRLMRSKHPLDDANLSDRARDITFREMQEGDIETCLAIYRANEAAHFPAGKLAHFESALRDGQALVLMATREDRSIGCCGLNYTTSAEGIRAAWFCYGMVDPAFQRQGVGTAQALVRIGLLKATNDLAIAAMLAVPGSVAFHKRFGFEFLQEVCADDGVVYPYGMLRMSQSFIDDCRAVMSRRRIVYPDIGDRIPERVSEPVVSGP